MTIGPIALAYNVAGLADLRLTPATVARIFAGTVTVWNDPAIAADNPQAVLPATPIRTVHRSDSSGTTANLTAYLAATAGRAWPYGTGGDWPAPGGSAQRGSNGVATTVARTAGAIGYTEGSYARFHHLATVRVRNGAGEFTALTDAAAGRTVAAARSTGTGGDLRLSLDHRTTVPGAYPIVLVTYEVVCRTGTPAAARPLLTGFLTYTAGPRVRPPRPGSVTHPCPRSCGCGCRRRWLRCGDRSPGRDRPVDLGWAEWNIAHSAGPVSGCPS